MVAMQLFEKRQVLEEYHKQRVRLRVVKSPETQMTQWKWINRRIINQELQHDFLYVLGFNHF